MEANLRILQSFKKINEKINDNEEKQKEINKKIDDFLKDISKEIKEIDNENQDLKKELSETIEKVKQEKPKDGKDGKDGRDGKDGYTPVKGKDYFDGKDGADGLDGKNGVDGKNGKDGKDGQDGEDGIGIYNIEINDKGELIITLTNGKKINCGVVKGKDGIGYAGVSVTNAEIVNGELIITLSTGRKINAGKVTTEGTNVDLTGYATEQWVKDQDYMPIPDFQEYVNFMYYTKDQTDAKLENYYDKEEVDAKLEDLPTGGTELTGGDNTVIEENKINVYTNTGYKVSDKDIQLQTITDSGTSGTTKMVYIDGKEIIILYDGTNKIRRSENGIDFEVIILPTTCKYMAYNSDGNRLYATNSSNCFMYSEDTGLTWKLINNTNANGIHQLAIGFSAGFRATYKTTKEVLNFYLNTSANALSINSRIKSAIVPEFTEMVNNTQFVWCNSTGTFKYGAGTNEGDFASLSGITVNLLKRVNNITFLGLKNSNKMYLLEPATSIRDYKWIEHTLLDTCTLNDIIYNPYDETYYLFTDVNTYYKTKDFVNFEPIDKNGLRGIQGYFTSMGIQTTTSNHNQLFLAPTRTKLENKAQEWDRLANKELWVGNGLDLTEEGKVNAKSGDASIGVSPQGIFLIGINEHHLPSSMIEALYVAKAKMLPIDPYEFEERYWNEFYPVDTYSCYKLKFTQDGSFMDQANWETEYIVEAGEFGYIFVDVNENIFKYEKLGNFNELMNGGL